MKVTLFIVGGILVILGAVWILQGFNVLTGGAMSGHRRWALIGGALAVVGIIVGVIAGRLKKRAA